MTLQQQFVDRHTAPSSKPGRSTPRRAAADSGDDQHASLDAHLILEPALTSSSARPTTPRPGPPSGWTARGASAGPGAAWRTLRRIPGAACLAVAALALGACAPSDTADAGTTATHGPLDEFRSRIMGVALDPDQREQRDARARLAQDILLAEEMIAACMAEHGFSYLPRVDASGSGVVVQEDADGPTPGSLEFAEIYGFGIAHHPGATDAGSRGPAGLLDPNQRYLDAMSDAERLAWEQALWGPPQEGEWDIMQAGCNGRAMSEAFSFRTDDEFAALRTEMDFLRERIEADPRLSGASEEWAACMTDAGHPHLTGEARMIELLHEEWGVIQGWAGNEDLFAGWDWAALPEGPDLPAPDAAAVTGFAARELALAVANHACRESADLDQVFRDVDHEHQRRFVVLHADELEAWAQREEARRAGR